MESSKKVNVNGACLELLPEKAIYWKQKKTLIAADLHLGKSGHFRKAGIPAPASVNVKNLDRLQKLIDQLKPETLLILGDLFHSDVNREWFQFEEWMYGLDGIAIKLVLGNHDLLHPSFYQHSGIRIYQNLKDSGFLFVHDPKDDSTGHKNLTIVSGHIHPGITLRARGRQSFRLPCFIISPERIVVPAFGEFTGLKTIKPNETEQVFAVVDNVVVEI